MFNSIPEILEDLKAGLMVIVVDDEDRENEGDLVMAASSVKSADINFMAKFGRGRKKSLTLAVHKKCQTLLPPFSV